MKKLFFITLLTVLSICANINKAFSQTLDFAVISDCHISITNDKINENGLTKTIHYLQQAIFQINKSDVDFVVFAGDNIDKTNKTSVVMFAKIINSLKKPYYVITGNQDVSQVSGLDKKKYFQLVNRFSRNKIRKLPYAKKQKNIVFLYMDGTNQFIPGYKGYFKEDELIWLDKKLTKYKDQNIVIVQHYPLVEPFSNNSYKTFNRDEYFEILNKHKNVVAIVSGHYHSDGDIKTQDGIVHINVPSLADTKEYMEIETDCENKKCLIKTKILDVR